MFLILFSELIIDFRVMFQTSQNTDESVNSIVLCLTCVLSIKIRRQMSFRRTVDNISQSNIHGTAIRMFSLHYIVEYDSLGDNCFLSNALRWIEVYVRNY